jgi:hypothetical protein
MVLPSPVEVTFTFPVGYNTNLGGGKQDFPGVHLPSDGEEIYDGGNRLASRQSKASCRIADRQPAAKKEAGNRPSLEKKEFDDA